MALELIEQKAVEIIDKLQGPGLEVAIKSIQLEAQINLIKSIPMLIAVLLLASYSKKFFAKNEDEYEFKPTDFVACILLFISGFFLLEASDILNTWNWISLTHPEYTFAHQLMQKMGN